MDPASELMVVTISACLAGAVFGDHCSPVSDTTIMASTGAQCDHMNHVATQFPYASLVAVVSLVMYAIAGFLPNAFLLLPIGVALMVGALFVVKAFTRNRVM
jgi:Na+/H+ antiporter NhaC